ncbi:MAG: low temperature requirement protein A [Burkholderiales bacterium]|nr:MAG: low temperature requirement protein A [Burkholderiales bacterium]TAG82049.1 MAG: low temperature requirement protein A [Betaproteobacteria bacterium]
MVELFFDLVFVFAVTQLSHALLDDLTWRSTLQVGLLLLGVWWVWIYTSWVTNWLDPERVPVRTCLFVLMLAGLVMSASIPQAFGDKGLVFASAYVFMQIGRTLFFLWAVRRERIAMVRNFQRILVWFCVSAVFWIAGALAKGDARLTFWTIALLIEFLSPSVYFWVPGLGRSSIADWDVDGGHMAERCALFIIIALGESLLLSGATFAKAPWSTEVWVAFLATFVSTVAMWWLYFDKGEHAGARRISNASDPGRHARIAYTYLHLPIVAGIIVSAVADELVIVHPHHATDAGIAAIIGGPALYLVGVAGFKWVSNDRTLPPLSHLVGLALLLLLMFPAYAHLLSAVALYALVCVVLLLVAAWEHLSHRQKT